MATGSDQLVGFAMMTISAIVFTYYTLWVIVMPFVDEVHPLQSLFLPRIYALLIPIAAGVIAMIGLVLNSLSQVLNSQAHVQDTDENTGTFISIIVLRSRKSADKKTN